MGRDQSGTIKFADHIFIEAISIQPF